MQTSHLSESINGISLRRRDKKNEPCEAWGALSWGALTGLGSLLLWATGVVDDQHDVDAVGLQQVHEKAPVSLGVQTHAPRVLGRQGLVLTGGHLQQSLKYPVVLLKEKPAFAGEGGQRGQKRSPNCPCTGAPNDAVFLNVLLKGLENQTPF